jgi:alkylation response protein AidB-like acyl-CoA dehydrogenase
VHGEVFTVGYAETRNDMPLLYSTTKAERIAGVYRFNSRNSYGSLTPVWTYLSSHGMDTGDPSATKIVHAFMPPNTSALTIQETWDVLGMRATRSDDIILDGVFVPDMRTGRVVPTGAERIDPFVLGIFAWALLGFANIYYSLARQAFDWTLVNVRHKTPVALSCSMAYHAELQHAIAQMAIEIKGIGPHIDNIAQDWAE